jgi:two-component system sensor histidine kinase and response regulator WspE
MSNGLSDVSMADLFRREVERQSTMLTDGLLALERNPSAIEELRGLMRAAHSLKGAARIVGYEPAVQIAHAMEDCFVAAQAQNLSLENRIDGLLAGVDLLGRIAQVSPETFQTWTVEHKSEIERFVTDLKSEAPSPTRPAGGHPSDPYPHDSRREVAFEVNESQTASEEVAAKLVTGGDRVLRVTADNLSRLLALAGETLVTSRWLDAFVSGMVHLRRLHREINQAADRLQESLSELPQSRAAPRLTELRERITGCDEGLLERLDQLDAFDRRFASFSKRLYQEVLDCRMRPFADAVQAFPRVVRDLARSLGKVARLEIIGESATVDREILERIKAPLDHLLRNALDHGLEPQEERQRAGKSPEGIIRLEAAHSAGKLLVTVVDDGYGIELAAIRQAVVKRNLTTDAVAQKMSDVELFEFLFLPGFSLKESVSEISGRGVGLDVVQTMVKELGGTVRVSSRWGQGTCFQLELPLTLSMIRTLLVEIGGEPYAFPLARIDTALKLPFEQIQSVEARQHFNLGERQVGLVSACEILELGTPSSRNELSVVVLADKSAGYGIVVDRFLGERELVVRPLDPRLGKVKNISAASLMPDGSPLLIVDVDDLVREIAKHLSGNRPSHLARVADTDATEQRKRVLVVDDSLTVREVERKLLYGRGYAVDVAVDGVDGWNAVRTGRYDLVVTDIDMPRLDGIELVTLIRKDSRLKTLPVMIVSYKDREEDRKRGLEAGADYYLTKGSFHDETLIRAVVDLIGETRA